MTWADSENVDVTRFGSPTATARRAGSVLRARAQAAGLAVRDVDDVDIAAAVVAADGWMLCNRTDTLTVPARHGRDAVATLAAILSRAAGYPTDITLPDLSECSQDPDHLRAAEQYAALVEQWLPGRVRDVFERAASDLAAAGTGTRMYAYGALLLHL